MTGWVILGDVACLVAGGAIIWIFKERLQSTWLDANTIATRLRAKADDLVKAAKK